MKSRLVFGMLFALIAGCDELSGTGSAALEGVGEDGGSADAAVDGDAQVDPAQDVLDEDEGDTTPEAEAEPDAEPASDAGAEVEVEVEAEAEPASCGEICAARAALDCPGDITLEQCLAACETQQTGCDAELRRLRVCTAPILDEAYACDGDGRVVLREGVCEQERAAFDTCREPPPAQEEPEEEPPPPEELPYSCESTMGMRQCVEYAGTAYDDASSIECDRPGQVLSRQPCDAVEQAGFCLIDEGGDTERRVYYYMQPSTMLEALRMICEQDHGGVFLLPNGVAPAS